MAVDAGIPNVPGVYVLLFALEDTATLTVGALGYRTYPAGWYAYVGSARGGLRRRLRYHLREKTRTHWHVDYVLARSHVAAALVVCTAQRVECVVAAALGQLCSRVPRFGASDCRCPGHLVYHTEPLPLYTASVQALWTAAGQPWLLSAPEAGALRAVSPQDAAPPLSLHMGRRVGER